MLPTKSGLQVFTTILDGIYLTGRKVTDEFKQMMEIVFDDYLPQWNYTAVFQTRFGIWGRIPRLRREARCCFES
ncbi:hypothetical protein [uncultured Nostoc sp.]|uniref:ISAzo13-like element transposase-related protein n=1 Tax=uncultured Nostoc sp. TaxID=340711 RepID=UPI0035CA79F3